MGTYVGKDGKLHYSRKLLGTEDKGAPTPPGKPLDKTKTRDPNRTANKLLTGLIENGAQSVSNLGKRYVNNAMNELYSDRSASTTYKTGSQKSTPKATVAGGPSRYDAEQAAAAQSRQARNRKLDEFNRRGQNASARVTAINGKKVEQYEKGLNKPASTSSKQGQRFDTEEYEKGYAKGMTADGKVRVIKNNGSKQANAEIARYKMWKRKQDHQGN